MLQQDLFESLLVVMPDQGVFYMQGSITLPYRTFYEPLHIVMLYC